VFKIIGWIIFALIILAGVGHIVSDSEKPSVRFFGTIFQFSVATWIYLAIMSI
jgi:hypothetical protein